MEVQDSLFKEASGETKMEVVPSKRKNDKELRGSRDPTFLSQTRRLLPLFNECRGYKSSIIRTGLSPVIIQRRALYGPIPMWTRTFGEIWKPLVHANFRGSSYGPMAPLPCFQENSYGPMALKVRQKFPLRLAFVHRWLFPVIPPNDKRKGAFTTADLQGRVVLFFFSNLFLFLLGSIQFVVKGKRWRMIISDILTTSSSFKFRYDFALKLLPFSSFGMDMAMSSPI